MKSPIVLLLSLLTDVSRLERDVKGLERDAITLKKRTKHEGYGFLTIALPVLGDALNQGYSTGQFACPREFKTIPKGSIPRLFSALICKVFDPHTGQLVKEPDVSIIVSLTQLCFFFKKVTLSSESSDKLHSKACKSFVETDQIAGSIEFDTQKADQLRQVCDLLLLNLDKKQDFQELDYKHGPGAVAEGLTLNQKWSEVARAIENYSFRTDLFGHDIFSYEFWKNLSVFQDDYISPKRKGSPSSNSASSSSAKLITVEKDSTSRRTITVEPVLKQFIQQGLNLNLRDCISSDPILRQSLALTDQTLNQNLALIGSLTDEWSTLDLKSASDLLSLKLFKLCFQSHPRFLEMALVSRSETVKVDKTTLVLQKFAGMGNALMFPVQSVIFAAISIVATLQNRNEAVTYRNVMRSARDIRVYGDDIIVKREYSRHVVDWLHSFGLQVNTKKSFFEGDFKESCGVNAFRGYDVTPVRLRVRPDDPSTEASDIASLVATSNLLWSRCYYSASDCLKREVEERLGKSLPLLNDKAGALGWVTRQNSTDATKWDLRMQELFVKAPVVCQVYRRDKLDGYSAFLKSHFVPLLGRAKRHLEVSSVRFQLRIVWKWVPARAG